MYIIQQSFSIAIITALLTRLRLNWSYKWRNITLTFKITLHNLNVPNINIYGSTSLWLLPYKRALIYCLWEFMFLLLLLLCEFWFELNNTEFICCENLNLQYFMFSLIKIVLLKLRNQFLLKYAPFKNR